MSYQFTPNDPSASAATITYGVQDALSGYILQDVNVNEEILSIQIPDQEGAIAQIKDMQKHWTVSFTAIGPDTQPATVGESFTFGTPPNQYIGMVNSCERRATYNDTAKWTITMDCYDSASYGPLHTT